MEMLTSQVDLILIHVRRDTISRRRGGEGRKRRRKVWGKGRRGGGNRPRGALGFTANWDVAAPSGQQRQRMEKLE